MPIYEYQCSKCGIFEATQRITERALAKCPTCKGKVKRLISNTSFLLKGSGWYITDYARKGQNGEAKGANGKAESKSDSGSKSESKAESSSSGASKSSSASSATSV